MVVQFQGRRDAYSFAEKFMKLHHDYYSEEDYTMYPWDYTTFDPYENGVNIGHSNTIQIFIYDGDFHPLKNKPYMNYSNPIGTVLINEDEALVLGHTKNPVWFIPGESETLLWKKEDRTLEDLDLELDEYTTVRDLFVEAY